MICYPVVELLENCLHIRPGADQGCGVNADIVGGDRTACWGGPLLVPFERVVPGEYVVVSRHGSRMVVVRTTVEEDVRDPHLVTGRARVLAVRVNLEAV